MKNGNFIITSDIYVIVEWPEVQVYQEYDNFDEWACLDTREGAPHAQYFVNEEWKDCIDAVEKGIPIIDEVSAIIEEDEFSHYCPTYMGEGEWE